jgi:bis(5'-nucleosyl)-tetraphosphatase (symmetrical)
MRYCAADGRMNLKLKGAPRPPRPPWMPWFDVPGRASSGTRIVFGHWSTLGFLAQHGVVALDTGCVWGGSLTALDLDAGPERGPIAVACTAYQAPGDGA